MQTTLVGVTMLGLSTICLHNNNNNNNNTVYNNNNDSNVIITFLWDRSTLVEQLEKRDLFIQFCSIQISETMGRAI